MLKLDLPVDPFWADLPHGVRVRIKPVTTAIVSAAQHRAARLGREAAEAAGGELEPGGCGEGTEHEAALMVVLARP